MHLRRKQTIWGKKLRNIGTKRETNLNVVLTTILGSKWLEIGEKKIIHKLAFVHKYNI